MLKIFFATIIVGVTVWTTRAHNVNKTELAGEIQRELYEYVKLDGWQQLMSRHLKFIVNEAGEVISERHRLKFNTIIHNALYGCDHERDDEAEDCPNISRESVKSAEQGKNLRAAMFRAARCVFVEFSIKHVVLSDALLNTYPTDKLDEISDLADKPIREYDESLVNMLTMLVHGETSGLGELMALHLYLDNKFGTVFLYKIPAEPVRSTADFENARKHMRNVHAAVLGELHAFWDTWCSDRDVVTQYRVKYGNRGFAAVAEEMKKNTEDAENFVRGLNVSDNIVDLDLDPKKIVLADFVNELIAVRSMPDELLADLQLRAFEVSFEFNPREVYEYHRHVFKTVYTCFWWTVITHLRLGVRLVDELLEDEIEDYHDNFMANVNNFVKPLKEFDANSRAFVSRLPAEAARNLTKLISFLTAFYRALEKHSLRETIASARPTVVGLIDAFSADTVKMLNVTRLPTGSYHFISYDDAAKLMQTNYYALTHLVSATSGYTSDHVNLTKLKKCLFFLSEAVPFEGF